MHIAIEPQPPQEDEPAASAPEPSPRPPEELADDDPADDDPAHDDPAGPPAPGKRFRPTRRAAVVLATAAVGAGAAVLILLAVHRDSGPGGDGLKASGRSKPALSPADCPVLATNPAPAPPTHKGDSALFIADITLPDCTRVGTGRSVTKVWRLKNAGKVPWKGYSLRRLDVPQQADQCQTISDVPIDDTEPGAMVDIRAEITTPRKPGLCYVRFKMVDAAGKVAFPGSRPVNFQVIVEG
jgi:hypothetical protein